MVLNSIMLIILFKLPCGKKLTNRVAAYIERYQALCVAVWAWYQSKKYDGGVKKPSQSIKIYRKSLKSLRNVIK